MFHLRRFLLVGVLFGALSISGCANLTHLTRTKNTFEGQQVVTFADAKQRIVVSSNRIGKDNKAEVAICAEPSPDALSAIAASQGFSLTSSDIDTALSNAVAESAGSIGLRTQSIQLMRDSMYRLCEAHISGAVGDLAFETLHRRFQSSMVAILAIEQLTGVARPPSVVLGSSANVGNAELAAKYTDLMEDRRSKLEAADAAVEEAEKDTKTKQEEYDAAVKTAKDADGNADNDLTDAEKQTYASQETALQAAKDKEKSAKETQKARKADFENANAARLAALSGESAASAEAKLEGISSKPLDQQSLSAISNAVESIVDKTLGLSFSNELCTTVLIAAADGQFGKNDFDIAAQERELLRSIEEKIAETKGALNASMAQESRLRAELDAAARNRERARDRIRDLGSIQIPNSAQIYELQEAMDMRDRLNVQIDVQQRELGDLFANTKTLDGQLTALNDQVIAATSALQNKEGSSVPNQCLSILTSRVEAERAAADAAVQRTKSLQSFIDAVDPQDLIGMDTEKLKQINQLLHTPDELLGGS